MDKTASPNEALLKAAFFVVGWLLAPVAAVIVEGTYL
jgi:hypothetical protein